MRLFGRAPNPGDTDNPNQDPQGGNGGVATLDPPNLNPIQPNGDDRGLADDSGQSAESFTLPEGLTLEDLYDEDGLSRYTDDDGNAVMEDGTRIPERRPDPEPNEQPEPEPQPAPDQRRQPTAFVSPFADDLLSTEELAEAEEEMSPRARRIIETMASRIAAKAIAAYGQQQIVARDMGIDPETYAELAPRMARMAQHVPANMRGTKKGEITNIMLALADEALESEDLIGTLQKVVKAQGRQSRVGETVDAAGGADSSAQRRPSPPALLPPSARGTTPRANPETYRTAQAARGPRDVANDSFHKDGIEGDVIATIRRERKRGY